MLGDIQMVNSIKLMIQLVGYLVGGILILGALMLFVLGWKARSVNSLDNYVVPDETNDVNKN